MSSVQFSRSVVPTLRPHEAQHARPPCPSPTPGVYLSSCPLSRLSIQPSHPLSSPFLAAAAAESLQSCLTLCDPIDCIPPGSVIPGILQERPLEWVAISFSNAWKWKVKVKSLSLVWLFATPMNCSLSGSTVHRIFQAREPGVGCHCLLHPFSSCPQSFPASGSFPMSQLFTSGGQSIGVSASTSVLPVNTQDWSPLGWTGWIA